MSDNTSASSLIRHVVFFSSKREEDIDRIVEGLAMLKDIPTVRTLDVCRNQKTDRFGNDVDVVVYAEFDNQAALDAYRAHPIYQECIKRVRPMRDLRFAADF